MRALFFVEDSEWTGCSRAFVAAGRGLTARGHEVVLACCAGSAVERRARAAGLETLAIDPAGTTVRDAWWLRRALKERGAEVVFVHTDREQLVVGSAMRLTTSGAVVRRVPSFQPLSLLRSGRFALRMAATGALFSTQHALQTADLTGLAIPGQVAPLGVDAPSYDAVRPVARASIGAPATGPLIVCRYDERARLRAATVLRTLALLVAHHPELHLAIVGPGSLDGDLRMHAAALGVGGFVSFVGEPEDELALLRAADAGWVVASHDDGAWAFLDFMALRVPVLAERGPLPAHYVADGITGALLSPGDPSQTAAAVAAFLANADRRVAMGNAARTRVQRDFSEQAMIDGFERALQSAGDRSRWAGATR